MNHRITAQLRDLRVELAPGDKPPALVAAVAAGGAAPLGALAELAAQQQRIITSDRRSLLLLATRCADRPLGAWFAALAEGESTALGLLPALAAACGSDPGRSAARPPLPGCQAYPAYLAWLALNGRPDAVAAALVANFAAWGGYCAALAEALRRRHGFDDEACAFFDFFARPATALEEQAAAALAHQDVEPSDPDPSAGLHAATLNAAALPAGTLTAAREYGRLLQAYERLFWETLTAPPTG
ncbi:transcriptional regulator [Kitasatospora sp. NPDC058218]|uniref:transcriptional regulator n=1 Tax=Kitasatospora sp. NPDC058218 TaxID=3346385 RepID=UPI0036DCB332